MDESGGGAEGAAPWRLYAPPSGPAWGAASVPTRSPLRSRLARHLYRDAAVVSLIAISMSLSAYAVFEATRAADEARDLYNQTRQLEAEVAGQDAYLQTVIDGDLAALGEYCAAKDERDADLPYIFSFLADTETLVTTDATATMMRSLLQGDRLAGCDPPADGYSTERAVQAVRDTSRGIAPPQTGLDAVQDAASAVDRSEQFLMLSGFLFALVVGMLVIVDSIGGRRRERGLPDGERDTAREWLAVLWPVPFTVGLVLLGVFGVDGFLSLAIAIGAAAIVAAGGVVLARRPVRVRAPGPDAATPRWIAELVGAAIIVLFAVGALGFSHLEVQEREATARADHVAALARDLQQVARHESLREIAAIDLIARIDAEISVSQQPVVTDSDDDVGELASTRTSRLDDLAARLQSIEDDLRTTTREMVVSRAGGACPDETRAPTSVGTALLDDISRYPGTLSWRLWQNQQAARACDVVAALAREEARTWAGHGSSYTIALVLLGLAGFVLALAADSDRTRRSAIALLGIGGAGAIVGLAIMIPAMPDIVARASIPTAAEIRTMAAAVAYDTDDSCAAVDDLDRTIASIPAYGPAYAARADAAAACESARRSDGVPLETLGSDADPDVVARVLSDMETAVDVGPATPLLSGNLAWYRILHGIQTRDETAIASGRALTEATVAQLEGEDDSSGTLLHILRFNLALADLATGDDRALADYRHAIDCVHGLTDCPGGELLDPEAADRVTLGAVGDLELLGDRHDEVRRLLLGVSEPAAAADPVDLELDVFPLELQVVSDSDEDSDASIVWYVRQPAGSWVIATRPSLATMHEGSTLDRPFATDEGTADLEFRADVYIGGVPAHVESATGSTPELARVASRRLGMSAAVPSDWEVTTDDGLEWHVGPDASSGLTVRRLEGASGWTDLTADLHAWTGRLADEDPEPLAAPWVVGAPDPVAETWGDDYLGEGLLPYGTDTGCGGTIVQVLAGGDGIDADLASDVFESLVLDRPIGILLAHDGTLAAGGMQFALPSGWDAAVGMPDGIRPYASAGSCTDGAYVDVWRDDAEDSGIDGAVASETRLQSNLDHTVVRTEPTTIPGADEARILDLAWDLDTPDPVNARVVIAIADGKEWRVSLIDQRGSEENAQALDTVVDSLAFASGGAR